jgi:hypothetical protein
MTQLRRCFNWRIFYDFGGDHKMLRAVLVANPEVMLTWS